MPPDREALYSGMGMGLSMVEARVRVLRGEVHVGLSTARKGEGEGEEGAEGRYQKFSIEIKLPCDGLGEDAAGRAATIPFRNQPPLRLPP